MKIIDRVAHVSLEIASTDAKYFGQKEITLLKDNQAAPADSVHTYPMRMTMGIEADDSCVKRAVQTCSRQGTEEVVLLGGIWQYASHYEKMMKQEGNNGEVKSRT